MSRFWDGTIVDKRIQPGRPVPNGPRIWSPDISRADNSPTTITPKGSYFQPTIPGPATYQLKLRNGTKTSRWITVEEAYYGLSYGTYVDLNRGLPPYEPPRSAATPRPAGHLKCTVARLMASLNISNEERSLWVLLSHQIQEGLQARQGTGTLIIGGNHNRKYCPDPYKYWGTITVAVTFKEGAENSARFIAQFDRTRDGNLLLVRVNEGDTFEAPVDEAITRVVGLVISTLGI